MPTKAKSCGPCTFCCKVMAIHELAKPAGAWCPHALQGKGCAIYGSHPASCREFACQWLVDPALPHRFRPDQSKVVLTLDDGPGGRRLVAHCDPANAMAWKRDPTYGFLKGQARATWGSGTGVMAKAGRRMWLIAPDEDVDLGELDSKTPFVVEQERPGGPVKVTVLPGG